MSASFRDAHSGDAPVLSELGRTTFIATFGHLYKKEDLDTFLLNHSVEAWREQLQSREFAIRIAEVEGRAVGFAKIGPIALPVEPSGRALELRQLYVLEEWKGKGIARQLMDWVLTETRRRGCTELFLSVYTQNARARRFYGSYGFEFVRPYAFMVGDQADEDEILRLELELGQ